MLFANTVCESNAVLTPSTLSGFPTRSGCLLKTTTLYTHHGVAPREAVNMRDLSLSR